MKILHTSDWHLGKKLFRLERIQEHQLFLDWLIEMINKELIDVLLIAGDIFDSPTPPHHALEMFYNFLHRLSQETKTFCYIIAGNHDSGLLLDAPSKLLQLHRIKVWGRLSSNPNDHWLEISAGEEKFDLCAIPFFRSYELIPNGEGEILDALKKYILKEKTKPQLLLLHHLAGSFEAAGSEQVISLSGVESIPSELLQSFNYVALGHIHKPQKISRNAYYSGSPIPMRFSETHKKSIRLLELNNGEITSQVILLPEWRKLHILKTNLKDWREDITKLDQPSPLSPVIEIQLELDEPMAGLIDEIKNILKEKGIELLSFIPTYKKLEIPNQKKQKLFELSLPEIFEEFYLHKYPATSEIPIEVKMDFIELIQKAKNAPHSVKD